MSHKVKRSRGLAPIWGDPLAPARSSCIRRSNHPFGETLCLRSLHRLQPTLDRDEAHFRDRTEFSATQNRWAPDPIPKNDPPSQTA